MRAPRACDTAFPIAAAVGTVDGSPMPTELVLLTPSQTETSVTSICGQSRAPAILYSSTLGLSIRPLPGSRTRSSKSA